MSQDTLKNYTIQTLNYGTAFLTRLSNIPLTEDLSNVKRELLDCFTELQKVWKSVNKLAFKLDGDINMDKLRMKIKQMDNNQAIIIKPYNQTRNRSKSIENHFNDKEMGLNLLNTSACNSLKHTKTPSPPYSNWSPRVPTKHKFKIKSSFSTDINVAVNDNNNAVEKNKLEYVNYTRDLSVPNQPQEKSELITSLPTDKTRKLSDCSVQSDVPNSEHGYLILESVRRLPPSAQFSFISKAKNVNVNHWKLGERYCGIADDILYIFFAFQDVHAEISMELPNLYIGKGFETNNDYGKSVLFQSREVHLTVLFQNEELRDKCYTASFKAQNKRQQNTKISAPLPTIPKPYVRKEQGPRYLNTILDVEMNVKHPTNKIENQPATVDSGEEDYVEMMQSKSPYL
ncbi:hypothetical protein LOD99_8668 [Oopsacas minuta]|uniref:Uncharacterized protein n=1 Tax=Oopsacas minuta TaxID=111878 RepID=A0AAV7JFJ9_9METZ|nr:hypothetical protein LOD99_8668 [Oopsacas minuta]